MPMSAPDQKAILNALERVLAWPEMMRSPQLGRFLDYIVRQTIAGEAQGIKAYSIAVDVFGRPADFDPQTDPIVRVQARRLRALLDEYYTGPGSSDPVRISLPTGRYVPEFRGIDSMAGLSGVAEENEEDQAGPSAGPWRSWLLLAMFTLALGSAAFAVSSWQQNHGSRADRPYAVNPPRVLITEFQNLAGEDAAVPMAAGLAIELVTDLGQFDELVTIYGPTSGDKGAVDADFALTGVVRPDGAVVQYSAILTDVRNGGVAWDRTIPASEVAARQLSVLDFVSSQIALTLGSTRGPLHSKGRALLLSGEDIAGRESLYLCRLLFDLYRETGDGAAAARTARCYEALSDTERGDPSALAAVAILTAEYADPSVTVLEGEQDRLRFAADTLERALQLDPTRSFIWQQWARLHEVMGDVNGARSDYKSALQLNPASADALAGYARLLVWTGSVAEAEQPSRTAIRDTPSPPPWYFGAAAVIALESRAEALALTYAQTYMAADRELGLVLAIAAAVGGNNSAAVNRYLPQLLDLESFRERGILPRLRERMRHPELLERFAESLLAAGVPPAALEQPF